MGGALKLTYQALVEQSQHLSQSKYYQELGTKSD
jgi:hypothetical protein